MATPVRVRMRGRKEKLSCNILDRLLAEISGRAECEESASGQIPPRVAGHSRPSRLTLLIHTRAPRMTRRRTPTTPQKPTGR